MINRRTLAISVLLSLLILQIFSDSLLAQTEKPDKLSLGGRIQNDPIRIDVISNGNMGVFTYDETKGSDTDSYVPCYFDQYTWGTLFFATLENEVILFISDAWQDLDFNARQIYILKDGHQTIEQNEEIRTCWHDLCVPGLSLEQIIRYQSGSTVVEKEFIVTYTGEEPLYDLTLLHGGDICFYLGEMAVESLTVESNHVFVVSLDTLRPQQTLFFADDPWDHWYAGDWLTAFDQVSTRSLSNSIDSSASDVACFVGWSLATLEKGESWSMITQEDYALPSIPDPTPEPTLTQPPQTTPETTPTQPEPELTPSNLTEQTEGLESTPTMIPLPPASSVQSEWKELTEKTKTDCFKSSMVDDPSWPSDEKEVVATGENRSDTPSLFLYLLLLSIFIVLRVLYGLSKKRTLH